MRGKNMELKELRRNNGWTLPKFDKMYKPTDSGSWATQIEQESRETHAKTHNNQTGKLKTNKQKSWKHVEKVIYYLQRNNDVNDSGVLIRNYGGQHLESVAQLPTAEIKEVSPRILYPVKYLDRIKVKSRPSQKTENKKNSHHQIYPKINFSNWKEMVKKIGSIKI